MGSITREEKKRSFRKISALRRKNNGAYSGKSGKKVETHIITDPDVED